MTYKAREIMVHEHHGVNKQTKSCYVYRGWYSGYEWSVCYHARYGIRVGSNLTDITEDAMFNLSTPIKSIEEFVEHVDDMIAYYKKAYPSLKRAYDCEGGFD